MPADRVFSAEVVMSDKRYYDVYRYNVGETTVYAMFPEGITRNHEFVMRVTGTRESTLNDLFGRVVADCERLGLYISVVWFESDCVSIILRAK